MAPGGSLTMRRYTVTIDDATFTIDVAETTADSFEVSVEGRMYEATLTGEHDLPGVAISPQVAAADERPAAVGRPASPRAVPAPRRESAHESLPEASGNPVRPGDRASSATLTAPMPGVVLEVDAIPGAAVRRGDSLLVLEAMKMRNILRAPRDATVVAVEVAPGAHVASGDVLVRFGPPAG